MTAAFRPTTKARAHEMLLPAERFSVGAVCYLRHGLIDHYRRFLVDPEASLEVVRVLPGVLLVNVDALVPELQEEWLASGWPVGAVHCSALSPEEQRTQARRWNPAWIGVLGDEP